MTFLERLVGGLRPLGRYLVPFSGFDAIVSLVLAILIGAVILQNRRRNQSITSEVESLIRRYVIFRGHRQTLLKVHQGDEEVKHEMLRAISNSWNNFRGMLEGYSQNLQATDRRARNSLCILGLLLVLNSLRTLGSGTVQIEGDWGVLFFLLRELPMYLFLLTGFLLINIQSRRWGKRPLASFDGELEAVFSDTQQAQEALNNEFDPIEESFQKEVSWPEES
ncbi:MAG: hypothetical protein JRJ26_04260 [Deltaproteobacteria bacterium]|nr:hypothetical protein [Deltaproteobacteria bacterium]